MQINLYMVRRMSINYNYKIKLNAVNIWVWSMKRRNIFKTTKKLLCQPSLLKELKQGEK